MKIYLAACLECSEIKDEDVKKTPYVLQTFYSINEKTEKRLDLVNDILLDSGAFSLRNKGTDDHSIYEEYVEKYAEFINKHNIKHFFELDIDNIVGYAKVIEYRKKLERLTNKQPIVVWHPQRGIEEYYNHCKEYKYIALGGFVAATLQKRNQYLKLYPNFINVAHKHGCKIHGLGFTSLQKLPYLHFDSVDSTTWLNGVKYGILYKFNGKTLVATGAPEGKRGNSKLIQRINFEEWVKFQRYAERRF